MIPLVAYIHYSIDKSIKRLALWFMPVIIIPLIWPLESIHSDQFDLWYKDVIWQAKREGEGLIYQKYFILMDPFLFISGAAGIIFAIIKRDLFILLFIVPFIIFFSFIEYAQYFYWIPVLPAFSLGAALLIYNIKLSRVSMLVIVLSIATFGFTSATMLITTNVTSCQFKTLEFIAKYGGDGTILASPVYSWILIYLFDKDAMNDYSDILFYTPNKERIILIADPHFHIDITRGKQLEYI